MPEDKLPSMDDFTDNTAELPSVDEFISEEVVEELPSVEQYIVDVDKEVEYEKQDLPSINEEVVDESLPSVESYIEKEEEEIEEEVQTLEDANGETFAEVKDIVPPWPELLRLVDEVRESIPDIPEIKYYDDDLEKISQTIEELRSEIPVVPEVKYYDEEVSSLDSKFSDLKEFVSTIPNYDVDEQLNYIQDKFNEEIQKLSENIEVKDFESRVDVDTLKTSLKETTENIYEELKKSSDKINEHKLHLKDDDRKLKKQILGQFNLLKENIGKKVEEFNNKNIESQNVITGSLKEYFDKLQDKINNLPEIKYYDKEIDQFQIDIKELREIVDQLKETQQQDLQENLLNEPSDEDNKDPLTPLNQNFVTLDQLQEHYRLFVNRVQQQLASFSGGGETKLQYLDDIVGIATNLSDYNGKFLKVDTSQPAGKNFIFATTAGGGYELPTAAAGTLGGIKIGSGLSIDDDGVVTASGGGGSTGVGGTWAVDSIGINTTKNVGIGTTSKDGYSLYVQGNAKIVGVITATTFDGNLATTNLTGTITNAQLAGSIANNKLSNSSVSYGGISLALGSSDSTPAFDLTDATNYPTSSLTGTITNAQLAGSIANAKLSNSSVSYGGISLSLGSSDSTPAFDLTDATNYPTSSLSGTITNAQLAGSIANAKLSNSSVSYGGVELALGASDATPAFNLSDATNYPYGSLTGITTNIIGDTTPQLGGNLDFNSKYITGTGGINLTGIVTATSAIVGSGVTINSTGVIATGIVTAASFDGSLATTDLTGTITNAQLAGSIANNKLANSTVSYGGVELSLGSSDASPAFDLSDATNYPTSSLSGTITNAQLAGSIANSKLSNSSVNYGGVTLSLGGSDTTPAFDLSDATNYPYTSLTGITTHILGDTTPQLGGDLDGNSKNIYGVGILTATTFDGNLATTNLTGTITNAQLAGSIAASKLAGSIGNSLLSNSSVSYGGISLALGSSDSTPAFDLTDATNYPTSSLSGTITNAQLAGSIAASKLAGSIGNSLLSNSSVSYGGISLSLGSSDATPAFDLTDATNYPTSSLSGTITNAQLAGSIANAKLSNSSITVSDGSNSTATSLGGTITFSGTSNEVEVAESSGTITIGLPNNVTIGNNLTVTGNLQVDGSTTTINTSTMTVEDKNIEIAKGAANDAAANGAGITVDSGDGDKTWNWVDATDSWTSSEHIDLASGKGIKFNTTTVLSGTTLGSSIVSSSLTSLGTIATGTWQGSAVADSYIASASTWNAKIANVVEDTTPQLGGNLDLNSKDITGTGNINITGIATVTSHVDIASDSGRLKLGASEDLKIYHDGSNSYIDNDTGTLNILSASDVSMWVNNSEQTIKGIANGSVELYYNNVKTFETNENGATVYGGEGQHANLYIYADEGDDNADKARIQQSSTGDFWIENYTSGSWEAYLKATGNAGVELYYDNSKKFETTNIGVTVTGKISPTGNIHMPDNTGIKLGASDDFVLYHNTTDSTNRIESVTNCSILFQYWNGSAYEVMSKMVPDGAVELYYNNSKKFDTQATGVKVYGDYFTNDANKINLGTGNDLQIYHDGSNSYISNTHASSFYIQSNGNLLLEHTNGENYFKGNANGSAELYYDNRKTAETLTSGFRVLSPDGDAQLQIFGFEGSDAILKLGADEGDDNADWYQIIHDHSDTNSLRIQNYADGSYEDNIICRHGAAVELYYDASKKFETTSTGFQSPSGYIKASGSGGKFLLDDNGKLEIGDGADLKIYHDGSYNRFAGASYVFMNAAANEYILEGFENGAVKLYYDNVNRFETNAYGVKVNGHIYADDSHKLQLGSSQDLQIYHDGSHSNIINTTGNLYINASSSDTAIACKPDGAVELYYDNSKKLETTSSGVNITGGLNLTDHLTLDDTDKIKLGDGEDFQIYFDGTNSYIKEPAAVAGQLIIDGWNGTDIRQGATGENMIRAIGGAQVELYHNNSKKFETQSGGVKWTGNATSDGHVWWTDDKKAQFGASNDLEIYHDGTTNRINAASGNLHIKGSNLSLKSYANETYLDATANGAVEIFYDNAKKIETYSGGVTVTGNVLLNTDNGTAVFGAGNDLSIYHDSSGDSYITNSTGSLKVKSNYVYINDADDNNFIRCEDGSYVSLHFNGSNKIQTTNTGVSITTNAAFPDNGKAIFGASDDLMIYHDATNSTIDNNTGHLFIQSDNTQILDKEGSDVMAKFLHDGEVQLYYDNAEKLNTASHGVTIHGQLYSTGTITVPDNGYFKCGAGDDLQIYHDGTNNLVKSSNGEIRLLYGDDYMFRAIPNGANRLYYANSTKAETLSTGFMVNGHLDLVDSNRLRLGSSQDFNLYHDGSNSYILNTTGNIRVFSSSSSEAISIVADGAVSLSHANAVKLATTSSGIDVTGLASVDQLQVYGVASNAGAIFSKPSANHVYWPFAVMLSSGSQCGGIYNDTSTTYYNTTSDYRLKENEVPISDGITRLKQLKPYRFNFKVDPSNTIDGFFAHEVQNVVPEAVNGEKDQVKSDGSMHIQFIDLTKTIPLITAALQEAITKIETLEAKVAALESS